MIHTLSENVMMPIAGLILAFVMTLELIQIITDKNNFHEVVCCKRCISSTPNTTWQSTHLWLMVLADDGRWYAPLISGILQKSIQQWSEHNGRIDLFPLRRLLHPQSEAIRAADKPIGKYGRMRQRYLKEYYSGLYSSLILSEKLYPHLLEIDGAANRRFEMIMPELMKSAGVTEQLKASDPMKWVGLMNTLKAQAEEIILSELIYV